MCFLIILLNFVGKLLSVFFDGHGNLRHRIQHQIVHNDLDEKKQKNVIMISPVHHRGL